MNIQEVTLVNGSTVMVKPIKEYCNTFINLTINMPGYNDSSYKYTLSLKDKPKTAILKANNILLLKSIAFHLDKTCKQYGILPEEVRQNRHYKNCFRNAIFRVFDTVKRFGNSLNSNITDFHTVKRI